MGKYDEMPPEELRERLVRFGRLILRLEEEGELLEKAPQVLKIIGDLRQMLFAYEVRCTAHLGPEEAEAEGGEQDGGDDDPALLESLRVVEEALEREQELLDELARDPVDDPDDSQEA